MYQIWKVSAALRQSGKQDESRPILVTIFNTETQSSYLIISVLTTGNITYTDLECPIARNTIMILTQSMELGETCVNVHSQDHPNEI